MANPEESPIFRQRRIEAKMLKHVYEALAASHGEETAKATIAAAVRAASLEQAAEMAEAVRAKGGEPSMRALQEIYPLWSAGGALEIEPIAETEKRLDFDVTRCRYAEMYREMGLGHIGHLLSCQRDGTFAEGFDPRIRMERKETIMTGSSRCTFRYSVRKEGA